MNVGALAGAVALAVCSATIGLSQPAHPREGLAAYVYGVGGAGDETGANIPRKLSGALIRDADGVYRPLGVDDTYVPINYSASIPIDSSVAEAIPRLDSAVKQTPAGEQALVVGYSEGAIAAELIRRRYQTDPQAPAKDELSFLIIAAPMIPNGGIYARFPNGIIPGFTSTGATEPSRYNTTYVAVEYDTVSDFPAYFNPLAIANSVVAFRYSHGDASYDAADLNTTETWTKEVANSASGTDTYVLIPVAHLQLLEPLRDIAEQTGTTALVEPFLGAVEPALRVAVDMGYTDRENANPEQLVKFSLLTPAEKWREAAAAMPGAIEEGVDNFHTGIEDLKLTRAPDRGTDLVDAGEVTRPTEQSPRRNTSGGNSVSRQRQHQVDSGNSDQPAGPTVSSRRDSQSAKAVKHLTEKLPSPRKKMITGKPAAADPPDRPTSHHAA